jgi:prepilin-type N-terminal cleavage/methylation domain-containing protein
MPAHDRAFTLVELLVVISIIVVLLSLLTPSLDRAISLAERVQCAQKKRPSSTSPMARSIWIATSASG